MVCLPMESSVTCINGGRMAAISQWPSKQLGPCGTHSSSEQVQGNMPRRTPSGHSCATRRCHKVAIRWSTASTLQYVVALQGSAQACTSCQYAHRCKSLPLRAIAWSEVAQMLTVSRCTTVHARCFPACASTRHAAQKMQLTAPTGLHAWARHSLLLRRELSISTVPSRCCATRLDTIALGPTSSSSRCTLLISMSFSKPCFYLPSLEQVGRLAHDNVQKQ